MAAHLQKLRVDVDGEDPLFDTPLFATSCASLRTLSLYQVNLSTADLSTTLQLCPNVTNLAA